jgi:hypothetical protein
MRSVLWLALGSTLVAPALAGQNSASVAGRVVDKTTKAGVVGAELLLYPGARKLLSDNAGHFHFDDVPPGTVTLAVKRLGFAPESASFAVPPDDDIDVLVELNRTPQPLDTVNVRALENRMVRGKLAGFYDRKRYEFGTFIDADMLEAVRGSRLGDVIALRSAGSKLIRGRLGNIAWIATKRDAGPRPASAPLDPVDVRLGADPAACYADVWLDGVKVYTFGSGTRLFDINSIATIEVAAIEIYVGSARIPLQYNSSSSACGVVLIWTG